MATLFAYVDESGQDVKALFFVVSVLVVSSERDALTKELEQIEQESKKDNRKWHRADYRYRRDYIERVSNLDKLKNKIFFKNAKSRWGSCSEAGNINVSTRLLFAPDEVLESVCIHELAHLIERNHSEKFWALVEQAMPN